QSTTQRAQPGYESKNLFCPVVSVVSAPCPRLHERITLLGRAQPHDPRVVTFVAPYPHVSRKFLKNQKKALFLCSRAIRALPVVSVLCPRLHERRDPHASLPLFRVLTPMLLQGVTSLIDLARRRAMPLSRSSVSRALVTALAASVVAAPGARAQRKESVAEPAAWRGFANLFDSAAHSDSIVGAAVLLMRDGRVVAHHEYGWADRARGQRVTENTIFHYGSITKQLTAISIMQLRDRGKLTLDDRVTSYIPELRQVHDPYGSMDSITIRMLMSHSAGFQNPTWPYKQGLPWEPFEPTTWSQLVAMMPYQELYFKPGSKYSYSN